MGLEDFFGRPRGFFSIFSSDIAISSFSNFFPVAFFFEDCLFLVPERVDLTFEVAFSSARDPLSSSTLASIVIEDCDISESSTTSSSLFCDPVSRSSSDSSSSSFLRKASENARSSSIRASRSATGIW